MDSLGKVDPRRELTMYVHIVLPNAKVRNWFGETWTRGIRLWSRYLSAMGV